MNDPYLHIGMPKTGTSSIQYFLLQNRLHLLELGFWYPEHPRDANDVSGGHQDLLCNEARRLEIPALVEKGPSGVCPLFSWEGMYVRPDEMRSIFSKNSQIVVYLRRQDLRLESVYNQAVKRRGVCLDFETYLNEEPPDERNKYLTYLDRWASLFKKENIHVRAFERGQFEQGNILLDFLKVLGLEADESFTFSKRMVNPSYNRDALEFKRLVNVFPKLACVLDVPLQSYSNSEGSKPWAHALLSPARRKSFLSQYEQENETLALQYMGRKDGVLFRDSLPDDDGTWQPYPGLSEERIAEIGSFLSTHFPLEYRLLHQEVKKLSAVKSGDAHLLLPLLEIRPIAGLGLVWAKGQKFLGRNRAK